jgi:hypothetical protein
MNHHFRPLPSCSPDDFAISGMTAASATHDDE